MTHAESARGGIRAVLRCALRLSVPFALGLLLAQAGCSPSDADGDLSGLIAPPSVSVLSADSAAVATSVRRLSPSAFPADAQYFTDPVHDYTFDRASEEIDVVNAVLCLLQQARYGELVNRGLYLARIDKQLCDPSTGTTSQSGATVSYEDWIVQSLRRDPLEPQRVELWVPLMQSQGGGSLRTLFATLDLRSAASVTQPYGSFDLDFAGTPPFGDPHQAFFCGRIATKPTVADRTGFTFFELQGDLAVLPAPGEGHHLIQANVDLAADQSSGVARVSRRERRNDPQFGDTGVLTKDFRLAFDATTLVRREDQGPVVALSRTQFVSHTRRYNLYVDDTRNGALGERARLKTGMAILLPGGYHAFIGHFGLQIEGDGVALDGDVVHEDAPGGKTFTLRRAPGKLIECKRETTPLSTLVGEVFEWVEPWASGNPLPNRYRLAWNGADFDAFEQFDPSIALWVPIVPFVVSLAQNPVLRLESKRYGRNCTARFGDPDLAWYTERVASGDEGWFGTQGEIQLFGLLDCLRPQLTAAEVEAGDIHLPPAQDVTLPHVYRFAKADRVLRHDDPVLGLRAATLAPNEFPVSGPFVNGMRSGPLVQDLSSLVQLEDIYDVPTYFVWQTGAYEPSHWAGLIDDQGQVVAFDSPLQFGYTHSQANDANNDATLDGQQFLLEYRGDGQLFGIPFIPVDTDQDGQPDHDVPLFSIADGVAVGPGGIGWVVRAVERELVLLPAAGGPPAGLDPALADQLVLPDGGFYRTPDIGPVPTLGGTPTVVGGEIQAVKRP